MNTREFERLKQRITDSELLKAKAEGKKEAILQRIQTDYQCLSIDELGAWKEKLIRDKRDIENHIEQNKAKLQKLVEENNV